MRILLVEDEEPSIADLRKAIADKGVNPDLVVASTRDEAVGLLLSAKHHFDLVICDLRIPADHAGGSPDIDHGIAVYRTCVEARAGTPIRILSAWGTFEFGTEVSGHAFKDDPFGDGHDLPMIQSYPKELMFELAQEIADMTLSCDARDNVEIASGLGAMDLDIDEAKAIRILARRNGGVVARIDSLPGGMSASRVFRLVVEDARGARRSTMVLKVGEIDQIVTENERYEKYVSPSLHAARFASRAGLVLAGAGRRGAIGYAVAEPPTDLFSLLASSPERAASVVTRIRDALAPWAIGVPMTTIAVGVARQDLITDEELQAVRLELPTLPWDQVESLVVQSKREVVHGDLHGANVIVLLDDWPIVIDYGRVGESSATLDPLTLELSLVFHPAAAGARGTWPSVEQAGAWHDVDAYTAGFRGDRYVRQCRDWAIAVGGGDRDVLATAYAFVARQFHYPTTDRAVAAAILESIMARLT